MNKLIAILFLTSIICGCANTATTQTNNAPTRQSEEDDRAPLTPPSRIR